MKSKCKIYAYITSDCRFVEFRYLKCLLRELKGVELLEAFKLQLKIDNALLNALKRCIERSM